MDKKKEIFSRTLYNLGSFSSYIQSRKGIFSYLKEQRELQKYFLRSVEFNKKPWSVRSAKRIIDDYNRSIKIMKKTRSQRLAKEILKNIKVLQSQRFPDDKESPLVAKLFSVMELKYKKHNDLSL